MVNHSRQCTARPCVWSCPAISARVASSGSRRSRPARRPGRGASKPSSIDYCQRTGRRTPAQECPLGLVALNSDVVTPADGDTVPAGPLEVRGYAFAGGERYVSRVDVSLDGGATWSPAELLENLGPWAWRHWRIQLELAPGAHEIIVRAWDSSAATQPEDERALWNPKGYVNNARPRVRVRAVPGHPRLST